MSTLARFRIQTKILAVIILLGAAAALGAWYAGARMAAIDRNYSAFVAKDARASSTAPRLNRVAVQFQAVGYRIIAETDPALKRKLIAEFDKAGAEALRFAGQVKKLVPRHADTLGRIELTAGEVTTAAKQVGDLALAGRNAEALDAMAKRVNPLLDRMLADMRAVRDKLDKDIDDGSADLSRQSRAAATATYTIVGVSVAIALLIAVLVARFGIAAPLARVRDVLLALAQGDKSVTIPDTDRRDEVGELARAANTFRDNLVRMEEMETAQHAADQRAADERRLAAERNAAEKEATEQRIADERRAAMHRLADDFEAAVSRIVATVSSAATELEAAAATLTRTADSTGTLAGGVAAASEEASANVQTVASATTQMTSSVEEIGRQVHESTRITNDAVHQAEATDTRITGLSQAAARIGDVVKLITAIAEQTNLLALNATIEAARAGEAGKGFAVVAQEVKALAAQTAKATEEITGQVSAMQTETTAAVAAIKEIGGTIRHVSSIAGTIAAAVEEQGAATREIARNVHEAAQGTTKVVADIAEVNRGAGETGAASSQVFSSAQQLANESNLLKTELDKFLATIRAA